MNSILKTRAFTAWKVSLFLLTLCFSGLASLYFSGRTSAQIGTSTITTFYLASLTGQPVNNMLPRGSSRYIVDSNGNRIFETEVGAVNLPAGTVLGVFVDGNSVGTLRITTTRNGMMRLSTMSGQQVPTVIPGSGVSLRHNGQAILTGVFGAPPSPSPTASPMPTPSLVLYAPLAGPATTSTGIMPRSLAQYTEFGATSRRLGVFVEYRAIAPGTQLGVRIDGNTVGTITLDQYGRGQLRLDTANGQTVPVIAPGSTAVIQNGSTTILRGLFAAPPPRPSPPATRIFGGFMGGRQVVPPVTTEARGVVRIILNESGTQIKVDLGFINLDGTQTTATINGPAQPGSNGPVLFDLGAIGGTSGRVPQRTFDVTSDQVQQLRSGLWYAQVGTAEGPQIRGQLMSRTRPSGFMGSELDDISVFRPEIGTWFVRNGDDYNASTLGLPGDVPVSADYDGDGRTDHAIFRGGMWFVLRTTDGGTSAKQFGISGDIPVRGDYDGDGIADLSVFRPSTGVWYIWRSGDSGYTITRFGLDGDQPVSTDLDGDGRTDIAVFRPSNGVWYWLRSGDGRFGAVQFGLNGDIPLGADFDGDGAGDVSVYRPSTGVWYIWRSSDEEYDIRQFGLSRDVAVPGNYDGDGIADIAVFRPSNGVWYIWKSSDGQYDFIQFGLQGDIPASAR